MSLHKLDLIEPDKIVFVFCAWKPFYVLAKALAKTIGKSLTLALAMLLTMPFHWLNMSLGQKMIIVLIASFSVK